MLYFQKMQSKNYVMRLILPGSTIPKTNITRAAFTNVPDKERQGNVQNLKKAENGRHDEASAVCRLRTTAHRYYRKSPVEATQYQFRLSIRISID